MIPHNRPTLGLEEQAAAFRVLAGDWIAQGPEVEAFENELCAFLGLPDGHAVAVSSGSAALYLALWALRCQDKFVGVPVYSCSALRNAVALVGGTCVFFDCEEAGPNVDFTAVRRSSARILIAPSMFGIPTAIPEYHDCIVIEDLAQSLGAKVAGERIGLRGEVAVCSFYATKLATTGGQGGAVVSRNSALIETVRDYRAFDCRTDARVRFNFQMTDLQAAVGRVQLKKLPTFLEERERLFRIYRDGGLSLLGSSTELIQPVRYRAVMRTDDPARLITMLERNGVHAIVPITSWELLDTTAPYPNAIQLARTTISLPIYPTLAASDAERIAKLVRICS